VAALPAPLPALPGLVPVGSADEPLGSVLRTFSTEVAGAPFVPGLYRMLAHWPGYLAHLAAVLAPRLEAAGGVRAAEAAVDPDELAAAHERYAAERETAIPPAHTGPRPFGGVGGTRQGVKCLHAHYAWLLAGGDDPVGRWVADQLSRGDRSGASESR
jgi:hypothetical protein